MAAHEHKWVKVGEDDVVVISAHAIPGNESNVTRVIDSLYRAGAEVVHDGNAPVHVSGHASQEELKFMLNLVAPEWFIPVHGEYRHMVHHAELADRVRRQAREGVRLRGRRRGHDHATGTRGRAAGGAVGLHSTSTASSATSARACCATARQLAEEGVVVVFVTVDQRTGEIVTGPEIVTKGWVLRPRGRGAARGGQARRARGARRTRPTRAPPTSRPIRRHARRTLGKFINEKTRRRPAVIPVVMEV